MRTASRDVARDLRTNANDRAVHGPRATRQVTSKRRRIGAPILPLDRRIPRSERWVQGEVGPGELWGLVTNRCACSRREHAAARHWRLPAAPWRQGVAPPSTFPVGTMCRRRLLPLTVHCFIRAELPIGPRKKNARKSCRFAKGRVADPHHHALQPRHDSSSGEVVYPTALLIDSQHVLRWHRRLRCAARFFAIVGGG